MKRTSSFSQRLAELRQSKGWTLDEMGKAMGMNPQTLNRYELNQRIPKITDANAMAESVGINPLWLQGYDVEPLASLKREDINEMLTTTNRDDIYPVLEQAFISLTDEARREVLNYMRYLVEKEKTEQ